MGRHKDKVKWTGQIARPSKVYPAIPGSRSMMVGRRLVAEAGCAERVEGKSQVGLHVQKQVVLRQ